MSRIRARYIIFKLKRRINGIKKSGFSIAAMKYVNVKDQVLFSNLAAALNRPIASKNYYKYSELTFSYGDLVFCLPNLED